MTNIPIVYYKIIITNIYGLRYTISKRIIIHTTNKNVSIINLPIFFININIKIKYDYLEFVGH